MRSWIHILGALALAVAAPAAHGQSGGGYALIWSSLDCGSATVSAGGGYSLGGTIGQSEVGQLLGGAYAMQAGFWNGSNATTHVPPDITEGTDPLVFRLHGNAPNPFSETTAISFSLAREARVEMRVYDLAGRAVRTVLDRQLGAGRHQVQWDGRDGSGRPVAHGIYMVRLEAGEFRARRKLALVP